MHPAYSVIFFTTASGAGYGLLFWLGLGALFEAVPPGWMGVVALTVALALITAGLLASTFHLGHPERAIGAFSQWRSSWLSREGVAAVATYGPAGLLWLCWVFGVEHGVTALLGLLSAVGAIVTVYCTGMIYASLRTIRQWYKPLVPWIYLALAAATGGLLIALFFGGAAGLWPAVAGLIGLAVAAALKLRYWSEIDGDAGQYTVGQALGLKGWDQVRPLDPPHTQPNFVMREMGYAVGRKHAAKLRQGVVALLFALPALCLGAAMATGGNPAPVLLGVLSAAVGVFLERWLFFAEAEHVSMLYYGRDRA